MTIEDVEKMRKEILTPADIAPLLRCDPNVIRFQAEKDPSKLGFPVSKMGSRVKIPRAAFVKWFKGE